MGRAGVPIPHQRRLILGCWQGLPYLDANQIEILLNDLPEAEDPGRSGTTATTRVQASRAILGPRACAITSMLSNIKDQPQTQPSTPVENKRHMLDHLEKDTKDLKRLKNKYRCMKNEYGIAPCPEQALEEIAVKFKESGTIYDVWEVFAGSGRLSSRSACIPYATGGPQLCTRSIDRFVDVAVGGCKTLMTAPTCTPWSSNAKGWNSEEKQQQRALERGTLYFLAVMCFIQVILGRAYVIENPSHSDIFHESPLDNLYRFALPHYEHQLDQCMYGAWMDEERVKKSTTLLGNTGFQWLGDPMFSGSRASTPQGRQFPGIKDSPGSSLPGAAVRCHDQRVQASEDRQPGAVQRVPTNLPEHTRPQWKVL